MLSSADTENDSLSFIAILNIHLKIIIILAKDKCN